MSEQYIQRVYNTELHRVEKRTVDQRTWEVFYTEWRAYPSGIETLQEHVAQFFAGERTVPASKAPSISSGDLYFTFSNDMYQVFLDDFERVKKPYEAALKYGFRGYSKGGKNGVFLLRKQDKGLIKDLDPLIEKCKDQITQDLDCAEADLPELKKVKIVCHDPSGERVVGVMNQENGRAIFLGFGCY